ncbi:CYTH domain-containing protein [Sphingomonas rubra]|nr:CYTH domain-containing protein [Sphingomonas rubra]
MADEIELKLDLTREAIDALGAADFWPGEPTVAEQQSIYFDTPDQELFAAGLSLRIRRSGRKRVQTIKAEGTVRPTWQRRGSSDTTPV